jgi:hypothetical protein
MKRRGFTLVELCVSFATLALLAGLLLPAVMAARSAAREAECRSNLHQVAVDMERRMGRREVIAHFGDNPECRSLRCPEVDEDGYQGIYNQFIFGERRPVVVESYGVPSSRIVTVCDLKPIHRGMQLAAFLDGHVAVIAGGDVGYEEL